MLFTAIASLLLLGRFACSTPSSSSPEASQCFPWWDECQGQYFCGNLTAWQAYNETKSVSFVCFSPVPAKLAPSPGNCLFVPDDPASSALSSGSCQFVNPCVASLASCFPVDYQCLAASASPEPPSCSPFVSQPPPTQPCVPSSGNGTCEFFPGQCVAWPGFCNSGYLCGTAVERYQFLNGPQPGCPYIPGAVTPPPPGECIYQSGTCDWSDCTSWLDFCQTYWTCGTEYDRLVYLSGPIPPCPAPFEGYMPPSEPGLCQYNVTAGRCEYMAPPCESFPCPNGSVCEVYEYTGQPYCRPSCEVDHGGCDANETCNLIQVVCITSPCPAQVHCSGPVSPCSDSAAVEPIPCPAGSSCVVDSATGSAYCAPSCDLDNGGCPQGEACSLVSEECFGLPCPLLVNCTPIDNTTDPCTEANCTTGSYCVVSSVAAGQVYCQQTCDLDNGGCADDEECDLVTPVCFSPPCIPHVVCTPKVDACAVVKCPTGTYCVVDETSNNAYCQPSCDISNGGCSSNEVCSLEDVQCITSPCPPQVRCTKKDPCSLEECDGYQRCVAGGSSGNESAVCISSCYVSNGGCGDRVCIVEVDDKCAKTPCSSLACINVGDYRRGDCPAGMVYQSCGSSCPSSCDNLGTVLICTAVCVRGCFCPNGLVEYRDRCVDPLECPALLANPPPLNPLPLAENEVLVQLAVLNITVAAFDEEKYGFLNALQSILASNGVTQPKVKLHDVIDDDDEGLRSHSQLLVVVEITSDSISEDGTSAEDIVAIIGRNKDELPLSVSTIGSVSSPYTSTDDSSEGTEDSSMEESDSLTWIVIGVILGVASLVAIAAIIMIVVVIVRMKKSQEKMNPSSVKFRVKSSNLYGEIEPELASLEARGVDCDMKNDLIYKE